MPNQPKTPQRTIRMEDGPWAELIDNAAEDGETASQVIRRLVERYNRDKRRKREREEQQ